MLSATQPEINLSRKQSEAWRYLHDSTTTEILYGGGAGSGKSMLGCIWHINQRMQYPETRGLIGRAKLSVLEESTLVTFFKMCNQMGYFAQIDYDYNSVKHIITWRNGSKTILKDLFLYPSDPDFISLGSTEYTDGFIDEANEITEKAFDIVSSRIRWKLKEYNLIPKLLMTCNPSPGWIKDKYISVHSKSIELKSYQKFVQALLSDNPDAEFRELYHQQLGRMVSDYDKQRLIYGDWDVEREVTAPFAHQFNKDKHEGRAEKDNSKQLIVSMDFNINPFAVIFLHQWRDAQGEHIAIFDEAEIKNGNIMDMGNLIITKYRNFIPSMMITGDYTGVRRQQGMPDLASLYLQLERLLQPYGFRGNQMKLIPNPTHQNSRADCNYLLAHFPDFKINPLTCPGLCRDMRIVQVDGFGEIIKRNRSDISQRADLLDCFRSFVNYFCADWIDRHQKSYKNIYSNGNGVLK